MKTNGAHSTANTGGSSSGTNGSPPFSAASAAIAARPVSNRELDPNAFAVVDWQVQLVQYGAIELAYWLALSLTPHERRAYEPTVVRAYYATLVAADDDTSRGTRRAPLEEIRRNITAAGLTPAERDGRFASLAG